jgi:hypothetical protein
LIPSVIEIIFQSMTMIATTNLADHLRRLLEAVDTCVMAGRPRLLAGPMALLVWIRTWRMRRERAMMLEQFKALLEQFLVLLEDFRAGKLSGRDAPPVLEAPEQAEAKPRVTSARPRQIAPVRQPTAETPLRVGRRSGPDLDAQASQTSIRDAAFSLSALRQACPRAWSGGRDPRSGRVRCIRRLRRPPDSIGYARSLFLNGGWGAGDNCVHIVAKQQ